MRVRVYLATTEGPVSIDRITREPAVQSAVCLRRTTRVLPISGAYDAFVRSPSGVIERDFGPFRAGAFRIDLSAPVDDGESWQLAFYVAHDLARRDRLAAFDDEAEQILLLTGRVDSDRRVGTVAHVPEKLHAAVGHLKRWADDRKGVVIGVPPGNIDEVRDIDRSEGVALRAIEDAGEALAVRALPREPEETPRALLYGGLFLAGVVAVLIGFAFWSGLLKKTAIVVVESILAKDDANESPIPRDAPDQLKVDVYERRAPFDSNCPAVMFRGEVPRQVRMQFDDGRGSGTFDDDLCALGVVVDAGYDRYAAVTLRPLLGAFVEMGRPPLDLDGRRPLPGPVDWTVALPRRPQLVEYRLIAVGGDEPVDQQMKRLLRHSSLDAAIANLRAAGLEVIDRRIRLDR
jgi:hypothetical protein